MCVHGSHDGCGVVGLFVLHIEGSLVHFTSGGSGWWTIEVLQVPSCEKSNFDSPDINHQPDFAHPDVNASTARYPFEVIAVVDGLPSGFCVQVILKWLDDDNTVEIVHAKFVVGADGEFEWRKYAQGLIDLAKKFSTLLSGKLRTEESRTASAMKNFSGSASVASIAS
jgi:hypothetical protein